MSTSHSDFLHTLSTRVFIHQVSVEAGLQALFAKQTVTPYDG